ncbi:BT_2262 family domain-containing protein [Bacteroides pyogenes]|uniref:BT_2262 family domain-containing protein n=1 Tax=Bacteroides pyogenes TaxID=310300 RepID=UPI002FD88EF8
MKKIKYISIFLSALFLFTACEKDTEGVSGILHFELKGEQTMLVTLGTSYTEPGYSVIYKGEDITNSVQIVGTVNAQKVGLYPIEYFILNKDGVKTSRLRTVIVADPSVETDISGKYITAEGTFRFHPRVGNTPYPGFKVNIKQIAPGFFEISDFLGGYYEQRAGYGAPYACSGYVQLKKDNTITLLSSSILPWGDTLTGLSDGVFNPEEKTLSWKADYAGMIFTVVLK